MLKLSLVKSCLRTHRVHETTCKTSSSYNSICFQTCILNVLVYFNITNSTLSKLFIECHCGPIAIEIIHSEIRWVIL